jgi:hypothetical protein
MAQEEKLEVSPRPTPCMGMAEKQEVAGIDHRTLPISKM